MLVYYNTNGAMVTLDAVILFQIHKLDDKRKQTKKRKIKIKKLAINLLLLHLLFVVIEKMILHLKFE